MNPRIFPRRAAALVPALALLAAGCKPSSPRGPAAAAPAPAAPVKVRSVKLHTGPIDRTITLPALIQPYQQATICAKVPGYLKSISVDKGDAVEAGRELAELEAPELAADRTLQQAEVNVARRDLDRMTAAQAKAPDLVLPQSLDEARGRLETASAKLERTETLLAYTHLKAPFAGLVARRFADVGAFLPAATGAMSSTNAAVLTLVDTSRVRIQAGVPEFEAPRVAVGAKAVTTLDELPGRSFPGTVTRFEAALDAAAGVLLTEVELPNADQTLRPGMRATLTLTVERKPAALLAPAAAVGRDKTGAFVFLNDNGKAKRTPVTTGFASAGDVEITGGVPADATPLVTTGPALADGQAIAVTEEK
jgi:membrane fusion protein, multidrug efflux system